MCAGNGQGGVAWSSSAQAMRGARGSYRVLGLTPNPNPKPGRNPAGQSHHRARSPRATRSTCHVHAMHMHAHVPCTRLQRVGDRLTRCVKALLATPRSTPGALALSASPRQPTPAQPTPAHPNQPHPTPRRPPICPRHATLVRMSHACSGSVSPSSSTITGYAQYTACTQRANGIQTACTRTCHA